MVATTVADNGTGAEVAGKPAEFPRVEVSPIEDGPEGTPEAAANLPESNRAVVLEYRDDMLDRLLITEASSEANERGPMMASAVTLMRFKL
jgi:hypothetical protein